MPVDKRIAELVEARKKQDLTVMFQEYTDHHMERPREDGFPGGFKMGNSAPADPIAELVERQISFEDFNFCGHTDSTPVRLNQLQKWAFEGRHGHREARKQFANTMTWTLRRTTFDAYVKQYSLDEISYEKWSTEKIYMFVRILLDSDPGTPYLERPWKGRFRVPNYSDAGLERDHLLFHVKPEHYLRFDYHELVRSISEHPEDRKAALLRWLEEYIQPAGASKRRGSPAKERRDNLIRQAYAEGSRGPQICEILDRHEIPTTKPMQEAGISRWMVAWNDPDFNGNVRTIISKAIRAD